MIDKPPRTAQGFTSLIMLCHEEGFSGDDVAAAVKSLRLDRLTLRDLSRTHYEAVFSELRRQRSTNERRSH